MWPNWFKSRKHKKKEEQPAPPPTTLQGWKDHLRGCTDFQRFLVPLTSDLSLEDKAKLLRYMFDQSYYDSEAKLGVEKQLEATGEVELAQLVRLRQGSPAKTREFCQKIIEADLEGRWIIQREMYLAEEIQALEKSIELSSEPDTECLSRLKAFEHEMVKLRRECWSQQRQFNMLMNNLSESPLRRGFLALRKNPDWHLSPWLRQDCVARRGCCARECGCCERERNTERSQNRGHCTPACGCCIRSMGFSGDEADVQRCKDMDDFPFDLIKMDSLYSKRIYRAYIWGLDFLSDSDQESTWDYW